MSWFCEKKPEKKKKRVVSPIIRCRTKTFSWQTDWKGKGHSPTSHYRRFVKWYHCREQSKSFTMFHKLGSDTMPRTEIISYSTIYENVA